MKGKRVKTLLIAVAFASSLWLEPSKALAHCDGLDGP